MSKRGIYLKTKVNMINFSPLLYNAINTAYRAPKHQLVTPVLKSIFGLKTDDLLRELKSLYGKRAASEFQIFFKCQRLLAPRERKLLHMRAARLNWSQQQLSHELNQAHTWVWSLKKDFVQLIREEALAEALNTWLDDQMRLYALTEKELSALRSSFSTEEYNSIKSKAYVKRPHEKELLRYKI